MKISTDASEALATNKRVDLILVGNPKEIIVGLLNNEIGTKIGTLGETVSVKLTNQELSILSETYGSSINYVFLNRNAKESLPSAQQASEKAER